jgi:hypothetical protein
MTRRVARSLTGETTWQRPPDLVDVAANLQNRSDDEDI